MQNFKHNSETVTECVNYLMQQLPYPCTVTESKDLQDYGNEYQLTLNFKQPPTFKGFSQLPKTLAKLETDFNRLSIHSQSDFLITLKLDYTNNHTFAYLTFSK